MKRKTQIEVIQSVRREMPPPKRVIAPKKNKAKADKVGRKVKHKNELQ